MPDSCTPACIRTGSVWPQHPTQSARTKSDPSWFYKVLSGTESESGKLAAGWLRPARNQPRWFLHTDLLPDQMRLAKPWTDHPDRIPVGFAQYDLCLLWKNGTKTDAACRIWHIRYRFWLHAGQNASGTNPACLLGFLLVEGDLIESLWIKQLHSIIPFSGRWPNRLWIK